MRCNISTQIVNKKSSFEVDCITVMPDWPDLESFLDITSGKSTDDGHLIVGMTVVEQQLEGDTTVTILRQNSNENSKWRVRPLQNKSTGLVGKF